MHARSILQLILNWIIYRNQWNRWACDDQQVSPFLLPVPEIAFSKVGWDMLTLLFQGTLYRSLTRSPPVQSGLLLARHHRIHSLLIWKSSVLLRIFYSRRIWAALRQNQSIDGYETFRTAWLSGLMIWDRYVNRTWPPPTWRGVPYVKALMFWFWCSVGANHEKGLQPEKSHGHPYRAWPRRDEHWQQFHLRVFMVKRSLLLISFINIIPNSRARFSVGACNYIDYFIQYRSICQM